MPDFRTSFASAHLNRVREAMRPWSRPTGEIGLMDDLARTVGLKGNKKDATNEPYGNVIRFLNEAETQEVLNENGIEFTGDNLRAAVTLLREEILVDYRNAKLAYDFGKPHNELLNKSKNGLITIGAQITPVLEALESIGDRNINDSIGIALRALGGLKRKMTDLAESLGKPDLQIAVQTGGAGTKGK